MTQRTRPTKLEKRRILVVAAETVGGATFDDVILGADSAPPALMVIGGWERPAWSRSRLQRPHEQPARTYDSA